MNVTLSTALSGISAAQEKLRAAAQNTANQGTADYRRLQVEAQSLETGGVKAQVRQVTNPGNAEAQDMVDRKQGTYAFVANLRVLQTQVNASGALLNVEA